MNTKFFNGVLAILMVVALTFAACNQGAKEANESSREQMTATTDAVKANASADPAAKTVTPPPAVPTGPTTEIKFEESTFNFGTVKQGEKVTHVYKFKNTGDEPLTIKNAKGSCGCTVPEWPKEPIAPGAESEITVSFDSKGKSNKQTKTVTITANTEPAQTRLTITGTVEAGAAAKTPTVSTTPATKQN